MGTLECCTHDLHVADALEGVLHTPLCLLNQNLQYVARVKCADD